jgi:peroxiredoxin
MKKTAITFLLVSIFAVAGAVSAGIAGSTEGEVPAPPAIGATIEDFALPDADGKEQSLNSLKGKSGSVLIFVSTKCPVSNAYNDRMEKLAQDYKARGINVIGINANAAETGEAVKAHAAENKLSFPIFKDPANKVADRLGATVTPEAYFLDASNKLIYRGRIDNAKDAAQVNSCELRDAIEASLYGKPVAKTSASAFGCTINRA